MTHSRRSNFLLATMTVVGLVLAAELMLRMVAPVAEPTRSGAQHVNIANPYIRFEYPREYAAVTEVEAGLPGLQGRHFFTTNEYGFRGDSLAVPKPTREFRIFVVGGSTAECFYLDDGDDMSRVLQNELAAQGQVKVYNVGLSGTASDDHIALIAQRLVHLQPDLIVVFAGLNDLRRSILGFDYLHYASEAVQPEPCYRRWLMKSQIVRRLVYLKRRVDPDPEGVLETRTLESDYARKVALQRSVPETDADPRVDTAGYRDNLITLVGIARAHHFQLVFMTHPSTWNSKVDSGAHDHQWMRFFEHVVYPERTMDSALERFNDVMRGIAASDSVPLYDLARELPKSTEYFYDDCHFNRAGALSAGRGLASFLSGGGLVRARSSEPGGDE
jgi:GDSL-like Lipase/Acylhydrolase family